MSTSISNETLDWMLSQPTSALKSILSKVSPPKQAEILSALKAHNQVGLSTEHSADILRKRSLRSAAAAVNIPPVANPQRRRACLKDPELFLRTYNPTGEKGFTTPFAIHHKRMIAAIHERAISGGDKAVAAPRGDGKTTVVTWMIIYVLLAELVRSVVIVGATRKHAQRIFRDIKAAFARNELLAGDFPEISQCVKELDGAPQRAAKQHVNGKPTNIVWTQDEIALPFVPGSNYGGCRIAYYGLDSAIRGGRFDLAIIDDPETREVAANEDLNKQIEDMIDSDIAGLAYPNSAISRVVLTTIQNRHCLSYRITDPTLKPTFAGERYGVLAAWPTNMELWEEYIAKRQQAQTTGDKDGLEALAFYVARRSEMDAGVSVTNPHRFNHRLNAEGKPVEISAVQAFFNRIADWKLPRVLAELQNDPEEESRAETIGLSAGLIQTRISGLDRNELPQAKNIKIVAGVDIGKYLSHWVVMAFHGNAIGNVIDYGILETPNMKTDTPQQAIESALLTALYKLRTDLLSVNRPDFVLIDSGDWNTAIYEFIRQTGPPFAASKGWDAGRFNIGNPSASRKLFHECYAHHQVADHIWLYNVNTEYWKQQVHERFLTPTFDDQHQFNDGTLSLFSVPTQREHLSFAHHIVAEMRQELFIEGKGLVRKWHQNSRNNHWLDASALALAAAGCLGITVVPKVSTQILVEAANRQAAKRQAVKQQQKTTKPGRFLHRVGGWVRGVRK